MSESLKKFLEAVSGNVELAGKIGTLGIDDVLALAKELGFALTEADFGKAGEFADDELDAVAGGGACACVFGGGGKADSNDGKCVCAAYGYGIDKNDEKRCICPAVGGGTNS